MDLSDVSPWTARGLYLFALVLVASPVSDLLSTVWPLVPGDLPWRYGFLGLLAGYLLTPILGLALATLVAWGRGSPRTLKLLGVAMLLLAAILALAMIVFLTDVMQMRDLRAEDVRQGILVGGALQELKYAGACLVLGMLGLGAVKSSGHLGRGRSGSRASRIVAAP